MKTEDKIEAPLYLNVVIDRLKTFDEAVSVETVGSYRKNPGDGGVRNCF